MIDLQKWLWNGYQRTSKENPNGLEELGSDVGGVAVPKRQNNVCRTVLWSWF